MKEIWLILGFRMICEIKKLRKREKWSKIIYMVRDDEFDKLVDREGKL